MLNAQVGPAFGTFGTTPNFDAKAGYKFNEKISLIGEFGGLSHAAFEKAAFVAPPVSAPDVFTDSKIHVNGYHYNANLIVAPKSWDRITPYGTGGSKRPGKSRARARRGQESPVRAGVGGPKVTRGPQGWPAGDRAGAEVRHTHARGSHSNSSPIAIFASKSPPVLASHTGGGAPRGKRKVRPYRDLSSRRSSTPPSCSSRFDDGY